MGWRRGGTTWGLPVAAAGRRENVALAAWELGAARDIHKLLLLLLMLLLLLLMLLLLLLLLLPTPHGLAELCLK